MRKVLFVCGKAKLRSPTAADLFMSCTGEQARCGGVGRDAVEPVALDDIEWASQIYVMERVHKKKLTVQFGSVLADKNVSVLGIPDKFSYKQPELISLLKKKLGL